MSRTKKHWLLTRRNSLTRAQAAALPAICEKWRQMAVSTSPSDREKAEAAIVGLYEQARYPRPKMIWLTSPLKFTAKLHESFTADPEGRHIPHHYLIPRHGDIHLGALRYYTGPAVQHAEDVISREVPAPPRALRLDSTWGPRIYGPADARDFALADLFRTDRHRKFDPLLKTALNSGSFIPYTMAVVFLERPEEIILDQQSRLHSFDGPALVYRDGSGMFAIHGITVPRKWIDTPADDLDITEVMREENAGVRTALIAKYGFDRLLKNLRHKVVSKYRGNSLIEFLFPGRKWESAERPGIPTQRLRALHLKWKDKTGLKETVLPVPRLQSQFGDDRPRDPDSCEQVRRWTLGWPKEALAVAET